MAALSSRAAGPPRRRLGLLPREAPLLVIAAAIALALLAPLLLVALDARSAGWTEIRTVLFRSRSAMLLTHTVLLAAIVSLLAGVIGTAAAWITERVVIPGRRVWSILLVLPVAIPDFVVGYAWHSFAPRMAPLLGATIVMTMGTYPLVYLPVAAALRRIDPGHEEAAESLGTPTWQVFFRVVLPLLRVAVLGGMLLVALTVISEFGAFEILGYQTFTTEIFTEFAFDPAAAAVLGVPLVGLGLLLVVSEGLLPGRRLSVGRRRRRVRRFRSRRATVPALLGLLALIAVGVAVPLTTILYWMSRSDHATLPAAASLASATWTTLKYSALGAIVAVLLAVPVALVGFRRRTGVRNAIERSTYLTRAVPGVTIALSLVYFSTRYAFGLYESSTLLVAAYALLSFPLALVCVKASVTQLPATLIDVGQSLGRHPAVVFLRVAVPIIAPGLLAGFCLVFLETITELTATLVLAPIGVQTLATQFWAFQQNIDYSSAAPYALMMIGLAVVPGALLALWFDRDRGAST